MDLSVSLAQGALRPKSRLRRAILTFSGIAAAFFAADIARKAIAEAFVHSDFPEQLAIKVEQLPIVFPIHMITGALALLLLPLVIAVRHHPRVHRLLGRVAALDVTIAGLTAFPVAWVGPVTAMSAAGFMAQAIVWTSLLATGIWHIRNGRRAAHRRAMLLMAATASGAIFFRLYLAMWAILSHRHGFELFYSADAWIAWLGPLVLTAYGINRNWRILR
jgi:uncharacterized membrane protein YozB (DUF420 family)